MGNLARMVNAVPASAKSCLKGEAKCLRCGKVSAAAIETWCGCKPACQECGKEAEKLGYTVFWALPGQEKKTS